MDINQSKNHNFQSLKEFSKLRFHRKKAIIVLLVSLSLFSILSSYFSYSSINHHFKSFLNVFLSYYSTDKKYIFLLCNGILAFLITKSGMMSKTPSILTPFVGIIDSTENRIREFRRTEVFEYPAARIVNEKGVTQVDQVEEDEKENLVSQFTVLHDDEEIIQESERCDDEEDQEYQEDQEIQENQQEEDQEGEDNENEEGGIKFLISLVELNGKCDNFIKMMREGIKI